MRLGGAALRIFAAVLMCALPQTEAAAQAALCSQAAVSRVAPELRRESAYNVIFVRRLGRCASLTFRRSSQEYVESLSNLADPSELPVPYTRVMTLGLAYVPAPRSFAVVGVGAGTLPAYLAASLPFSSVVGVELDPVVLGLARDYFGLRRMERANLRLAQQDGRIFLRGAQQRFDVIFLDAYRGGYIPEHLTTREFYMMARSRLSRGGVLVSNLHAGTAFFDSSIVTLRNVFQRVDLYDADGNVIAISGDGMAAPDVIRRRAAQVSAQHALRYELSGLMRLAYAYAPPPRSRILTDDFSPANMLDAIESANMPRP